MAIAFINAVTNSVGASLSQSQAISFTAGNQALVFFSHANTNTVSTVTDSTGAVFSFLTSIANGTTITEVWGCLSVGASTSVIVTSTGTAHAATLGAAQYSGVGSFGTNGNNNGSVSPATVTLSGLASANSWMVTVLEVNSGATVNFVTTVGNQRANRGATVLITGQVIIDNTGGASDTCTATLSVGANWIGLAVELQLPGVNKSWLTVDANNMLRGLKH